MADAMKKHPEVDVLINFASLRSAYDSSIETMSYAQVGHGPWGEGRVVGRALEWFCLHHHLEQRARTQDWPVFWVKVVGDT